MSRFKLACLFISLYITLLVLFFVPTLAITIIAILAVTAYVTTMTVANMFGSMIAFVINLAFPAKSE